MMIMMMMDKCQPHLSGPGNSCQLHGNKTDLFNDDDNDDDNDEDNDENDGNDDNGGLVWSGLSLSLVWSGLVRSLSLSLGHGKQRDGAGKAEEKQRNGAGKGEVVTNTFTPPQKIV